MPTNLPSNVVGYDSPSKATAHASIVGDTISAIGDISSGLQDALHTNISAMQRSAANAASTVANSIQDSITANTLGSRNILQSVSGQLQSGMTNQLSQAATYAALATPATQATSVGSATSPNDLSCTVGQTGFVVYTDAKGQLNLDGWVCGSGNVKTLGFVQGGQPLSYYSWPYKLFNDLASAQAYMASAAVGAQPKSGWWVAGGCACLAPGTFPTYPANSDWQSKYVLFLIPGIKDQIGLPAGFVIISPALDGTIIGYEKSLLTLFPGGKPVIYNGYGINGPGLNAGVMYYYDNWPSLVVPAPTVCSGICSGGKLDGITNGTGTGTIGTIGTTPPPPPPPPPPQPPPTCPPPVINLTCPACNCQIKQAPQITNNIQTVVDLINKITNTINLPAPVVNVLNQIKNLVDITIPPPPPPPPIKKKKKIDHPACPETAKVFADGKWEVVVDLLKLPNFRIAVCEALQEIDNQWVEESKGDVDEPTEQSPNLRDLFDRELGPIFVGPKEYQPDFDTIT